MIVECWLWYKKAFLAPIENLYAAHGINNLILRGHATRPFVNIPMPHSYVLLGSLVLFPKVLSHSNWIIVCFIKMNRWKYEITMLHSEIQFKLHICWKHFQLITVRHGPIPKFRKICQKFLAAIHLVDTLPSSISTCFQACLRMMESLKNFQILGERETTIEEDKGRENQNFASISKITTKWLGRWKITSTVSVPYTTGHSRVQNGCWFF